MLDNFENINQRIQQIREAKRRSTSDCAAILGISTEAYAEIENGSTAPSVPQVELLAIFFETSSENLLSDQSIFSDEQSLILNDDIRPRFIVLRNKMISAMLKMAKKNKQISVEDIHQITQIPLDQLEAYEHQEKSMPLDHLFKIASALELPLSTILEQIWVSEKIGNEQILDIEWEPEYPAQEAEINQEETNPDQILLEALHKTPKEVQAQIAKIILKNIKP